MSFASKTVDVTQVPVELCRNHARRRSVAARGFRERVHAIAVNPPRPRMPPLSALKAFEAAARHESFAKAADELGVTPAAVSHQIKGLEEWLGSALFVRHAQRLQLTDTGKAALPAFSKAFDTLGLAVQELRVAAPLLQVSIAALPSVAQLWLAPKLPALREAFPKVRVSIYALEEPPNFRREPFDLAFFFTQERTTESRSFKICDDYIYPFCTPAIASSLHSAADVLSHALLWDTSWADDWDLWLRAAGVTDIPPHRGPAFSLYSLSIQAALGGAGIVMGHEALMGPFLASGALVAPFDLKVKTGRRLELLALEPPPAQMAPLIEWFTAPAV